MQYACGMLAATGLCNITTVPSTLEQSTVTTLQYVNWRITNCSPVQVQHLITSIDEIVDISATLTQALSLGSEIDAYRLFFKTNQRLASIGQVFQKIAAGEETRSADEVGVIVRNAPEFVCVSANDFTSYYWNRCRDGASNAMGFKSQPYVMLCPTFWSNLYPGVVATSAPTCPTGAGLPTDQDMIRDKTSTLFHELVHIYLRHNIFPEKYSLRDCAHLDAASASRNANNYAYYRKSGSYPSRKVT